MTLSEYQSVIIHLSYELYKAEQRQDPAEIVALQSQLSYIIKELKHYHGFTMSRETGELIIFTCDIPKDKLFKVFNYYDARDKNVAIVPKSLYKIQPLNRYVELPRAYKRKNDISPNQIKKHHIKRVPQPLKAQFPECSSKGYSITLPKLALILNTETSFHYNLRMKEEKRANSPHRRPDHDYRPFHQKL